MDIDTPPSAPGNLPLPEFSATFPLPFRVLFLVGLAQLLWAINLHVLYLLGLEVSWVLDIRDGDDMGAPVSAMADGGGLGLGGVPSEPPTPARTPSPGSNGPVSRPSSAKLYGPVYRLFAWYSTWCVAGWVLFRVITGDDTEAMERWRGLVGIICLGPVVTAIIPMRGFGSMQRRALRRAFVRCLAPPPNAPIFFCDVILADILTSFAKVLGDLYVSANQIAFGGISHGRVAPHGVGKWITLGMTCLPYIVRFRQCMVEFYHSNWKSMRPFANAMKYCSAFPVIFLSAMQKTVVKDIAAAKGVSPADLVQESRWFGEHPMFRMWLLAVVVNSFFSFYWDVQKDWGLSLLNLDTWLPTQSRDGGYLPGSRSGSPQGNRRGVVGILAGLKRRLGSRDMSNQRSPIPAASFDLGPPSPTSTRAVSAAYFGLRPTLLLPDPSVYYLFTILDFILRLTWSLELSSHLHTIDDMESGVFLMEALELVRRWMWVFVRVEWEAVRMGEQARFKPQARTAVLWEEKNEDD